LVTVGAQLLIVRVTVVETVEVVYEMLDVEVGVLDISADEDE